MSGSDIKCMGFNFYWFLVVQGKMFQNKYIISICMIFPGIIMLNINVVQLALYYMESLNIKQKLSMFLKFCFIQVSPLYR